MSIVSKKSQSIEKKQSQEDLWYRIYPDISRYINYAGKEIDIEINLPGVKKEDIVLKVLPTSFHLEAKRKYDNIIYSADTNFGTEIVPNKTTAKYNNGLLTIKAYILDPLEKAKEVELK